MRPLIIPVPRGERSAILDTSKQLEGKDLALFQGMDGDKKVDILFATFSNRKVEAIITYTNHVEDAHITLLPQGVTAMHPPVI